MFKKPLFRVPVLTILGLLTMGASMTLANTSAQPTASVKSFKNDQERASYIIGHQIAQSITNGHIKVDQTALLAALTEGLNGKASQLSPEESQKFMVDYVQKARKEQGDKNLSHGKDFLDKNKKAKDVVTLPSGLQYKVVKAGSGKKPLETDTVTVNYEGTLTDGTVFDSSYKRGQPATFPVNGVIKGWTEALKLMPEGSTWMLYIPAALAYGENGAPPNIGPNETLVFKVDLISIGKPKEAAAAPASKTTPVQK